MYIVYSKTLYSFIAQILLTRNKYIQCTYYFLIYGEEDESYDNTG